MSRLSAHYRYAQTTGAALHVILFYPRFSQLLCLGFRVGAMDSVFEGRLSSCWSLWPTMNYGNGGYVEPK